MNMQLASLRISSGTDYFYKTYGYNEWEANNGRIASITDNLDPAKSISYTYDELNRLATAITTGSDWGLSWSFDRYGNRLSQSVTKGTAPSNAIFVDTATNRVNTWTYDAAGNVTNDGRNTYAYDAENRVISINGGATTYTYDAAGSRVTKTTAGVTIRYYFGVAEKTDANWTKILVGTVAGVVEWSSGTVLFKSNDHLGSPRVITNSSGAMVGQADFFPYGEVWSETGTQTKYKFSGKERDSESGNDYFGARYCSNVSGRFLTVDTVFHMEDPQSLNKYTYVRNDPVNLMDPDGMDPTYSVTVWASGAAFLGLGWYANQDYMFYSFLHTNGLLADLAARLDEYLQQTQVVYPGAAGPSQNPNYVYVGNMLKSGPNQDRIREVANWIIANVDQDCANWLNGLGTTLTSLLGDPTNEDSVLIGHGSFSNPNITAIVGQDPSRSNMPPGFIIGINDTGAFFQNIPGTNEGGYQGGTSQAQVFALLHEMGHYLNAAGFQPDFGNQRAIAANDALVHQHCKRTLNAATQIP